MDEQFIRNRISALRIKKGVSEYRMSLDLGHSKSYIQSISSGKSLPSLQEFLYICEYFGLTPREFFDESEVEPMLVHELHEIVKGFGEEDLRLLLAMAVRIKGA